MLLAGCGGGGETTSPPPPPSEPAQRGDGKIPTGDGDGGVRLVKLGDFDQPVYVTQPPGEKQDLFVVEQSGRDPRGARRAHAADGRSWT